MPATVGERAPGMKPERRISPGQGCLVPFSHPCGVRASPSPRAAYSRDVQEPDTHLPEPAGAVASGSGGDALGLPPRVRPERPGRLRRLPEALSTRASEWSEQVGWLAAGVPPARIGWSRGPVTAVRLLRHRLDRRPVELCLLERHDRGPRFARAQAFWINQRTTSVRARVNSRPETADLVWVFSQDPLDDTARAALRRDLARVRPGVRVVNPPEVHDAYHRDDCFARLEAAGVGVPRWRFGPEDVGVTEVVYKARDEQTARSTRCAYRGEVPGYRAFGFVDARGPDGLSRRYRAYYVGGEVLAADVLTSEGWEVRGSTRCALDVEFVLTGAEREQVRLVAEALGLDFFAVDFLRRRPDGQPVVVDVNVYPTLHLPAGAEGGGVRGRWHFFDAPALTGGADPARQWTWQALERGLLALAGRPVPGVGTPERSPS